LFAAVSGDFSPLTVDTSSGEARVAPPAMLIALAVGLGSMDMPIPQVATWEWVNWKFPKPVRASETIYARWTLTQKRPPVHGARTGIVVWRVDVHTADGAMCAEGEIGAAVTRRAGAVAPSERAEAATVARPRRRRGRRGAGATEPQAKPAPAPAPPPAAPAAERTPRRRRRKRSGSGSGSGSGNGNGNGDHSGAKPPEPAPTPAPVLAPPAAHATESASAEGPLTRVMRRLRRT
jgi:acyl dehydratase